MARAPGSRAGIAAFGLLALVTPAKSLPSVQITVSFGLPLLERWKADQVLCGIAFQKGEHSCSAPAISTTSRFVDRSDPFCVKSLRVRACMLHIIHDTRVEALYAGGLSRICTMIVPAVR